VRRAGAEAETCHQAAAAETLRAFERRTDRGHQGTPETFLRAEILLAGSGTRVARRGEEDSCNADLNATGAPIDPEAEEIQQLKSAAMPLLLQLREDQKREVRTLARLIGLESVAAQI
jgi:hypothetical protein